MPWSKLKTDAVTVRRTKLLALRREGVRFDDQRVEDLGYTSPNAARKDITRALEQHRDAEAAEVAVYRQQENERLDELLAATWPRATQPQPIRDREGNVVAEEIDLKAIETVLKLIDRRAKLNGLDMPVKTELSGPDGGAVPLGAGTVAELNTLIGLNESDPTTDSPDPGTEPAEEPDDDRD